MAPNPPPARRRLIVFGPGAVLALAASAFLLGSGALNDARRGSAVDGRIVYRADAAGKLRRVDTSAEERDATPPALWKPQVGLLLERAEALRLTKRQQARLSALDAAWRRDRDDLAGVMRGAVDGLERPGASLTPGVRAGLARYSELSRAYDARRAERWRQGLAALDAAQRARVAEWEGGR